MSNNTIQAAVLDSNRILSVQSVPSPQLRSGGVIVAVLAAPMPGYTEGVLSGRLFHVLPPLPTIPGVSAIGRVEQVAEDVFDLETGQLVYVDPQISSHSNNKPLDNILFGWSGVGPGFQNVQGIWKDGSFAEKMLCPAECCTIIPETRDLASHSPAQWSALCWLAVSYGGLVRGDVQAGSTVVVNGATGGLGSLAVLLALSMGVAKVIATGRNPNSLAAVHALDKQRVIPVSVDGDQEQCQRALRAGLNGKEADVVIDCSGNAKAADSVLACLNALRVRGILVLVGSMDVPLPLTTNPLRRKEIEIRGSFMNSRRAPAALIAMVLAGTLDLQQVTVDAFPLAEIQAAIKHAESLAPLHLCAVEPAKESNKGSFRD